ncbi:MAG: HsdR family type I site-specific deoxyribonuclease [Bacteroidota bacterium]
MSTPTEYTLVEKPLIDTLVREYGYRHLPPEASGAMRARETEVLLTPVLVDALVRINDIPRETAEAVASDLARVEDNERWTAILRGDYSRKVPGEATHRTIRVIDFDRVENNRFDAASQLRVRGASGVRKPDVVVYVNGVPLVVIEAKSPTNRSQNLEDTIDQVKSAEREVPRLFAPNLFNVATTDVDLKFGATGSPREHWSRWPDPWPRKKEEFADATARGLYALLSPERLLDILAHFVVFETRDGQTVKKVCRYQQYRAVNKMVERVAAGEHRAGLIWHTQGSGKSLTMVFAALKLKLHRGLTSERLQNPNLLVLTDRIDLHKQITGTFRAVGIPNVREAGSIRGLREIVTPEAVGTVALSTIFKFYHEDPRLKSQDRREREAALREMEVPGSENWILMIDEAHRTQESDLGAYLQAALPHATRFGFTGTPVEKHDKNTFATFGAPGERYLDKYGIDDAVADGATVPIYYVARKTEWDLEDDEIDSLFDHQFVGESPERIEEIKRRGITKGDLARFEPRIRRVAKDIWAHYRLKVMPDGFKAQIVAIDRRACVAYKKALDRVIAKSLRKTKGWGKKKAKRKAAAMSVCVYSPGQHDAEQYPELVEYQIAPEAVTPEIVPRFLDPDSPLRFVIVCNKLLTGFDAPIEQAMYLDNPLTDHSLLQAIARTNRRYPGKEHGLIVDYIGVSRKLDEALSAYRREDVAGAMRDVDALHDALRVAHRAAMALVSGAPRTDDVKADVQEAVAQFEGEDAWFVFRAAADRFVRAYAALAPDPRILPYQADLKFVGAVLPYGRMHFEQTVEPDWKAYSQKVRAMLDEHLEVIGLKTVCKLRSLSDPAFWDDFGGAEDLKTAAVRKLAELKKETSERAAENPARYATFSDRVKELIRQFNAGLLDAQDALDAVKDIAEAVVAEAVAHEGSGLSQTAFDFHAILASFKPDDAAPTGEPAEPYDAAGGPNGEGSGDDADRDGASGATRSRMEQAALAIDALYASNETAPPHWQDKSQLRKSLRAQVRRLVKDLGLNGWAKRVPQEVERYAVRHFAKP